MQPPAQSKNIQTRTPFDCSKVFNKIYGCGTCEYRTQFLVKYTEHQSCIKNSSKQKSPTKIPDDFVTSMVCMVCNFKTFSKLVFMKHLYDKCPHTKCPDYIYNTKCSSCKIRHHVPKHTPIYNCEQCCFWSLRKYDVKSHNRHMHCLPNYNWLNCDRCSFQTLWQSSLQLHKASNLCQAANTDSWFECEQCTYKTKRKFCLDVHVFRKHRRFKCEFCDYDAPVQHYLELHQRIKHSIRKTKTQVYHPCDKCSYKALKKDNLDRHVLKVHETVKEVRRKKTEMYLCDRCAYSSTCLNRFRRHVKEQHTPADEYDWYRCEHCSYKGKQRYHLKLHLIQKHTAVEDIQWYECDKCPYKGKLKASLKNHLARRHSSN